MPIDKWYIRRDAVRKHISPDMTTLRNMSVFCCARKCHFPPDWLKQLISQVKSDVSGCIISSLMSNSPHTHTSWREGSVCLSPFPSAVSIRNTEGNKHNDIKPAVVTISGNDLTANSALSTPAQMGQTCIYGRFGAGEGQIGILCIVCVLPFNG